MSDFNTLIIYTEFWKDESADVDYFIGSSWPCFIISKTVQCIKDFQYCENVLLKLSPVAFAALTTKHMF